MGGNQQKVLKLPLWHGSVDDFKRVLELCDELREELIKSLQSELDAVREKAVSDHKEDMAATARVLTELASFKDPATEERFKKGLSVALERPELRRTGYSENEAVEKINNLAVKVYDDRHTGSSLKADPAVVLRTLNARDTKNIEISFGSHIWGSKLSVDFQRHAGVTVTVSGSDMTWVNGALERLHGLLGQRRPSYGFMRSPWISYPAFILLGFVSTIWVAKLFGASTSADFSAWAVVPWVVGLLLAELWNRTVLPRFELFESGSRSRAKFLVATLVASIGIASGLVGLFK